MDGGVVILDSNADDDRTNAVNSTASFANFLSPPLDFGDDDMEVGIKEIQYPLTWLNLERRQYGVLRFINPRLDNGTGSITYGPFPVIAKGRYTDIDVILNHINKSATEYLTSAKASGGINSNSDYVPPRMKRSTENFNCLMIENGYEKMGEIRMPIHLLLSRELAELLGFRYSFFLNKDTDFLDIPPKEVWPFVERKYPHLRMVNDVVDHKALKLVKTFIIRSEGHKHDMAEGARDIHATHPVDLLAGSDQIVVTSDVIKHHRVGNQNRQVMLMRPLPSSFKFGDIICERFDEPFYYPVSHQKIDKISIDVRDRTGKFIEFLYGSVIVTLHFRYKRG